MRLYPLRRFCYLIPSCSPEGPNPAAADMNWAVVVYVYAPPYALSQCTTELPLHCRPFQIFAFIYWYFRGYKTFRGPCPNLPSEGREKADVVTDHVREEITATRA